MLQLLRKKQRSQPELYPEASATLCEGVYNRWKSSYIPKMNSHSAMGNTIDYFVITALGEQTHVVRVMRDIKDSSKYTANYAEDSRVFHRPVNNVTASDVMNAYPLSAFVQEWAKPQDHFGLRRVGTLDEFVEKMKAGRP